ncbi:MAG TPA: MFS transporter [Gaiellales bacterium]|nr:MFS transporter [Gaiellales bacterium]
MSASGRDPQEAEAERLGPAPPIAPTGLRRMLGLATLDYGPLRRRRDFRLLFIGQAVSLFGSEITFVALPYQAYHLTGSSLVVGLLGLAELVPLLCAAFIGGALADAFDRRRMMQLTELSFAAASLVLVANALLPHPHVWVLFAVSVVQATLSGLQRPSLDALTPRLVERDELMAAGALTSFRMTLGGIAGPALGGVLLATVGLATTYTVDTATFIVSLVALRMMRAVPPPPEAEPPSLGRIAEGVRYAGSRQDLMGTYIVDIVAMFFGMPMALFPEAATHLGGAGVLGLLYAAPATGSMLATVTSGWTAHVHRHGAAVCVAAAVWGAGIVVFGLAPGLGLALAGLVLAGAADMISGIFRTTIWNQTIPDHLRGRLAGIEQVSYSTGPLLGNVESGVVASVASLRASIVSGGVLCIAGVAIAALALPAFWRYDARE